MRIFLTFLLGHLATSTQATPMMDQFGNGPACFTRSYSADHLNAHPDQRVTNMSLAYRPHEFGLRNDQGGPVLYPQAQELYILITATRRGDTSPLRTAAFCWPEGTDMQCGIECDGGSFTLSARASDSLLMRLQSNLAFSDCGENFVELLREPDDKVFLLRRAALDTCD